MNDADTEKIKALIALIETYNFSVVTQSGKSNTAAIKVLLADTPQFKAVAKMALRQRWTSNSA